jgi:hypothetical protein
MPARRSRRVLALGTPAGASLTTFVVKLGRGLGAATDVDAIDRVAHLAGVPPVSLVRALAVGTLAGIPTGAVRSLLTLARSVPGLPPVDISDLAPLDPAPLMLLVDAVRAT